VFCANDLLPPGRLQELFAAASGSPKDITLVGDDDLGCAAAAAVPLTSVRQPAVALGQQAAEMLIEETGPGGAAHQHRQVVRQSSLRGR
jgi:LacI family transcriptional regulator